MALTTPPSPARSTPTSECGSKRKRSLSSTPTILPLTPPLSASDLDPTATETLDKAVNVLSTAATALAHVTRLYQADSQARAGLLRAVNAVTDASAADGKLVICGIGKSGLIGQKAVATVKSLGIPCSFLHSSEAMHGDLGDVKKNDVLLFITFSGRTPELFALLPYLPHNIPIIVLTSHTSAASCPLVAERPDAIILPAPVHEVEEVSFGIPAPTTSTTVALAVADMLAMAVANQIHGDEMADVFRRNHPGGAIGRNADMSSKARRIDSEKDDRDAMDTNGSSRSTSVAL